MIKGPAEWYDGAPRGTRVGIPRNRFTPREIELLKLMWAEMIPAAIIAEKLGREECTLRTKAKALKLPLIKHMTYEKYMALADRIVEEYDGKL